MEEFITPVEAAHRKRISEAAVYKALRQGRLPFVRILGRYALRPSDVDAWQPSSWGGSRRRREQAA